MYLNVYSSNVITLFYHITGMRKRWTLKYQRKKQNSYIKESFMQKIKKRQTAVYKTLSYSYYKWTYVMFTFIESFDVQVSS